MSASELTPDQLLDGKYLVLDSIGAGGFGEVVLARDTVVAGRQVAIKALHKSNDLNEHEIVREMEMLARLVHPGIVTFFHHFRHASRLCLVMEYCAGGSLRSRMAQSGAEETQAMSWCVSLARTLSFAHSQGIVHHDVKPENILFSRDGNIKIADLGVANRDAGTQLYLPPEYFLEGVSVNDPRVDVYALGLTLLELMLGQNPLAQFPRQEWQQRKIRHDFIPGQLSRWVQEVILKATHPTPELRFQTMDEFAEAMEARRIPFVFKRERLRAHELAEKAEKLMQKKKWNSAERLLAHALRIADDCVAAHVAQGRLELLLRRVDRAEYSFQQALRFNPRANIQKELGWLHLESENYPLAISMLNDHLARHSSDYEAFNLLLKCFYMTDRYEAGEAVAKLMIDEKVAGACFSNNGFLCKLLRGGYDDAPLKDMAAQETANPFFKHNLLVIVEEPKSWEKSGTSTLKSKLIFQEFRYVNRATKANQVKIRDHSGDVFSLSAPLITFGRSKGNDICLDEKGGVSRRHAALVNLPGEVWLHDLGSKLGTRVESKRIDRRLYLDGVHAIAFGGVKISVAAREGLLV
jgi:tetratricopeptide (TPR) repeat protein